MGNLIMKGAYLMINVEREKVKVYGKGHTVLAEFTVLTSSLKNTIKKLGVSEEDINRLMTKAFMLGMTAEDLSEPVKEGEDVDE